MSTRFSLGFILRSKLFRLFKEHLISPEERFLGNIMPCSFPLPGFTVHPAYTQAIQAPPPASQGKCRNSSALIHALTSYKSTAAPPPIGDRIVSRPSVKVKARPIAAKSSKSAGGPPVIRMLLSYNWCFESKWF